MKRSSPKDLGDGWYESEEPMRLGMITELHEMGAYIQRTKDELASLRMKDGAPSSSNRINLATEELDEIVRSTERATSDILNAAEQMLRWRRS